MSRRLSSKYTPQAWSICSSPRLLFNVYTGTAVMHIRITEKPSAEPRAHSGPLLARWCQRSYGLTHGNPLPPSVVNSSNPSHCNHSVWRIKLGLRVLMMFSLLEPTGCLDTNRHHSVCRCGTCSARSTQVGDLDKALQVAATIKAYLGSKLLQLLCYSSQVSSTSAEA